MLRAQTISDIRNIIASARQQGKRIAFVPTMGYLHEGHLSLVEAASRHAEFVVTSIFVNPLQFGPTEDLDKYPRNLDRDLHILEQQGYCDVVFTPSADEMYPQPMASEVSVPLLSQSLCGISRPTHFQGVATVVTKLFHIVQPDVACFGQKDGQQLAIVSRMVKDLNFPIEIVGVPTLREADGLAKSSRNVYLSDEERPHATVLYRALQFVKAEIEAGRVTSGREVERHVADMIHAEPFATLDYAQVVDMETLQPVTALEGHIMIAIAVFFGKARLIDNIQLKV